MIVERHRWLAEICARQMCRRNEPLDDLVQTAQVALLMAVDRFDPTYGVAFRTFASATIAGELRRHYRSTWRVRVPRRIQELHLSVSAAIEHLTATLRRSPTAVEIAGFLSISTDDVVQAIAAGAIYWPVPLQTASESADIEAILGQHDVHLDDADARADLRPMLDVLPQRERAILYLRFFHELTQSEIAEQLQISQVHVSRLMRRALSTLRANGRRLPATLES